MEVEQVRIQRKRKFDEDDDLNTRLEELIKRIGEKSQESLETNLERLVDILDQEITTKKEFILNSLVKNAIGQPEKMTIYSTLVGLLNVKMFSTGGEFLVLIMERLGTLIDDAEWRSVQLLIRFLADLINCNVVLGASLLGLFDTFIATAAQPGVKPSMRDFLLYSVMQCLPWIGLHFSDSKDQVEFDRLLDILETEIEKREKHYMPSIRVWSSDNPLPQIEYMDSLWLQIKNMRNNNWEDNWIIRPYVAFESKLESSLQHPLPQFELPADLEHTQFPLPTVVFRIFDTPDVPNRPEVPKLPRFNSIDRFLVEDAIMNVINSKNMTKKECAESLLRISGRSSMPLNYMLVEVLFGGLLELPVPRYSELFYGSILVQLCQLMADHLPQVLAQAVAYVYERLDTMNTVLVDRFGSWFAYFLSNFKYHWTWSEWEECVKLNQTDPNHPKPKFLKEVFLKLLWLTFYEKLKDVIPEEFVTLLPVKPGYNHKFAEITPENRLQAQCAKALIESIKNKEGLDMMLGSLDPLPDGAIDGRELDPVYPEAKLEVVVQTILRVGCKSISHISVALNRFRDLIMAVMPNQDAKVCCLKITFSFFKTNHQLMCIMIEKYLNFQLIEPSCIVSWIFSPYMLPHFDRLYLWQMLDTTIKFCIKRCDRIKVELEKSKVKLNDKKEQEAGAPDPDIAEKRKQLVQAAEEEVDHYVKLLEDAERSQKEVFLIVVQRFIMILTDHIVRSEQESRYTQTLWFRCTRDRLRQTLVKYRREVKRYMVTLQTLLFTPEIEPKILECFTQFKGYIA